MDDVIDTVGEDMNFFISTLLLKPEELEATFFKELFDKGSELSFALLELLCSKTVKVCNQVSASNSPLLSRKLHILGVEVDKPTV